MDQITIALTVTAIVGFVSSIAIIIGNQLVARSERKRRIKFVREMHNLAVVQHRARAEVEAIGWDRVKLWALFERTEDQLQHMDTASYSANQDEFERLMEIYKTVQQRLNALPRQAS